MIQARRIAKANRIGGRKEAEMRVRRDNLIAVKKGELAINFKNTLDNKHHIRAASIIFIKDKRDAILQSPRQKTFFKFCHLLAITQDNRILAYQINTADMAIKVDAQCRPIQARCDLFDMG